MHRETATHASASDKWRVRFAGTNLKILLMDDDPGIRELWKDVLSDAAPTAQLVTAEEGSGALRIASELQPDVIVMDVVLPSMDGLEVTRHLKADRSTCRIPVILVTGSVCSVQDVLDAGCHGYLTKPVAPQRLLREIVRVLRLPDE